MRMARIQEYGHFMHRALNSQNIHQNKGRLRVHELKKKTRKFQVIKKENGKKGGGRGAGGANLDCWKDFTNGMTPELRNERLEELQSQILKYFITLWTNLHSSLHN